MIAGDRLIVVASRLISIGFSVNSLAGLVLPEYLFVRESDSIYGISMLTGVKVDLENVEPELRQRVLDSFSHLHD